MINLRLNKSLWKTERIEGVDPIEIADMND